MVSSLFPRLIPVNRHTDPCSHLVPEHVCAVTVSIKDKLDLSLSIAVGSTIQVALGILPLLVLIGWAMGQPMSLFFDAFQM